MVQIWTRLTLSFGKEGSSFVKTSFKPFPNKPWFLHVCSTSLLKTLRENKKLLVTSNFSFSQSVFYMFGYLFAIFIKLKIVVCKLSVWNSLECVVWERVNGYPAVCIYKSTELQKV